MPLTIYSSCHPNVQADPIRMGINCMYFYIDPEDLVS
jgi:hypothetical protein